MIYIHFTIYSFLQLEQTKRKTRQIQSKFFVLYFKIMIKIKEILNKN